MFLFAGFYCIDGLMDAQATTHGLSVVVVVVVVVVAITGTT